MIPKVLFLGTGGVSDAVRLDLPAKELSRRGSLIPVLKGVGEMHQHERLQTVLNNIDEETSACVFSRPSSSALCEVIKRNGAFLVVDVDDDFHSIPRHHVAWKWMGPGNPEFLSELEECIRIADRVTVTTKALRERWLPVNKDVVIIPNGWSKRSSQFWGKKYQRDTINFGWGGTITHREDFQIALSALIRSASKNRNIKIVIASDPKIYSYLRKVPEKQKLFIPMVPYDIYPHTLCYFDVMLAPLVLDEFNQHKSDIKLVDAGASRIPFIASPTYEYVQWSMSGFFPKNTEEWYEAILELAEFHELRNSMAAHCNQIANTREMEILGEYWRRAILE